ncbi:hypothetical protein L596_024180 [Steinernema carpocapsae]|uniref:Uncharacterized protein n=1 Tax=Steinernema carpocapsae TaxID=34508 RepID=A0A4U5MFZ9_STECR|nr:hypothetical protein L596_024180 [Steinernema carpocapsae]
MSSLVARKSATNNNWKTIVHRSSPFRERHDFVTDGHSIVLLHSIEGICRVLRSRRDSERERLTQNSSRSIDQFYADCHSIDPRIVSPFRSNLNKQKSKSENDLRRIALLSKESILNKSTPNLSQLRSEHFPNLRIPFALKSPQRNPSKPALPNFRFTPRPLS